MDSKAFQVGDRVLWRSQAAGLYATKEGTIVEVVPAGTRPTTLGVGSSGAPRNGISYVVRARKETRTRAGNLGYRERLYWPLTSHLGLAPVILEEGTPALAG
jgi:hypothetical protein